MSKKFYITTPIYYANAKPHIGHAYTTIAADVLARFYRLQNNEVFLLTGLDEHGLKIQKKAEETEKNPQEFVDGISKEFKRLWEKLNIQYDSFIRTTDQKHKKAVQKALQRLYDKGSIYKGTYEGLYCVGCEQFKTETELVNGKCPDHDKAPELLKEECYLLKATELQTKLIKKIEGDEFRIMPDRYKNEILSFLKGQELKDISVSRKNVKWGIPLPFDTQYTAYVWMDAFLNYLTGIGWNGNEKIPNLFPPDVQLIGKDILRVHTTMWPVVLMHLEARLPRILFTHGHILSGGKKMSKTLGNVIGIDEMISKFGVDGTRYILISAGTFGEDVDLTMERAAARYQADLANGLGNLVARVLTMTEKYFNSSVPAIDTNTFNSNANLDKKGFMTSWKYLEKGCEEIKLDKVIRLIFSGGNEDINFEGIIKKKNRYIDSNKPWDLEKTDKALMAYVIYHLLESLRHISWMIRPFMPETSDKIFAQLFADEEQRKEELNKDLKQAQEWSGLKPGTKIKKGAVLFPRL